MEEAEQLPGVKTDQIIIEAASPDVLAKVCAEITERVLKLIPEDALETISKQVLENGIVITKRKQYGNGNEEFRHTLGSMTSEEVKKQIEPVIKAKVSEFMKRAETATYIHEACADAFADAMHSLPILLANDVASRMAGLALPTPMDLGSPSAADLRMSLDDLKNSLRMQTTLDIPD